MAKIGEAVLELRTDSSTFHQDLQAAEERVRALDAPAQQTAEAVGTLGDAAEDASVKIQPMNDALEESAEQSALSLRSASDLSGGLAGISRLISIAASGNKELAETSMQATMAISFAATALKVYRSAAILAAVATQVLTSALLFLLSATGIGLVIAAIAALALGIKFLIGRKREAKEATEQLEQAHRELEQTLTDVTSATSDLTLAYGSYNERIAEAIRQSFRYVAANYAIRLSLQGLLGASTEEILSLESVEKARQRLIDQAITFIDVDAEAAAASKRASDAARERLEVETLLMEVLDEQRIAGEVMQVAVPRAQALAAAIKGLAFDARDAAGNLRELTDEVVDLTDAIQRGQLEAQRVKGLIFDARDISGQAGAAERVISETIRRLVADADVLIAQAREVADALGPEIAMAMLDRAIPAFEALGDVGNAAIERLLRALSELGKKIPESVVIPSEQAASKVAIAWEKAATAARGAFEGAFSGILRGALTFADAILNIVNSILDVLGRHIGGALFDFLFPKFGVKGFAHGGPLAAFQPAMVGEAGVELFVPRVAGTVIPHDRLAGGGGMQVFIDARGSQRGVSAEIRRAIDEMGERAIRTSVVKVADESMRGARFRR